MAFNALLTAPASWTYDCSCTDSKIAAYVHKAEYGMIYLCGLYWGVASTGPGSRADTLIHEGTHFAQVLDTSNYAYVQTNCKNLARSNPNNAVYNADNHALFSVFA
ncbi:hypothetical protein PM082_021179 [Marasmius tenuissimus]|nr:hypothetical protein PM082_021179 [Marasmius tenuissimus]